MEPYTLNMLLTFFFVFSPIALVIGVFIFIRMAIHRSIGQAGNMMKSSLASSNYHTIMQSSADDYDSSSSSSDTVDFSDWDSSSSSYDSGSSSSSDYGGGSSSSF